MKGILIFFVTVFFIKIINAYPNPNIKNKQIIDSIYKNGEIVTVVNKNFIPFIDFSDLKIKELTKNFKFKLTLTFDDETDFYKERYNFGEILKNTDINFMVLDVLWSEGSYNVECVQPFNEKCINYADLTNLWNEGVKITNKSKYFYKGKFYSVSYEVPESNLYCVSGRNYEYAPNLNKIKSDNLLMVCSKNSDSKYVNNYNFLSTFLNSINLNNQKSINEIFHNDYFNKNNSIQSNKEQDEKNKLEQKKKQEELEKKKREEEIQKQLDAERQKKLDAKKKELEEKRKKEEEKKRVEEELKRQKEEAKRKKEAEKKEKERLEAERKKKEAELAQNISSSKQLITRIKKDQQILSTNINKLQGNLELINSSNNILNLNKQMRLSESNYKSSDDIFISFDKNYEKVEKYYNTNPKTELNLIFTEFKLLKTEFNNQKKVINNLFQDITNTYTQKKEKIEKDLRDKEMLDAFIGSNQAIYYTYLPGGIAILLFILFLWRGNSSRNKITYLTNKIKDLEKNPINNNKPQQQNTKVENKKPSIEKQKEEEIIETIIEEVETDTVDTIDDTAIEKLNNLIDDDVFINDYLQALSDINSLRTFIEKHKIKGLDRYSSQRSEQEVELEISKRVIEKALFWVMEHPQTSELLIMPGRDLWSRSRMLMSDTSRFGYLNFNGIFDLTEGEEFKLRNFAVSELNEIKRYKVLIKGELTLPKIN